MKFAVFLGTVREGRLGIRAAKYMLKVIKDKGHEAYFFDPLEVPVPLLTKAYHHYENPSDAPKWLQDLHHHVATADAILVVSAEYNYSIPPALSNAMDHLPPTAYKHRPCGIVCYSAGQFGGVMAAMQLRSFLAALGMAIVGSFFPIPKIQNAFTEDGEPTSDYFRNGGESLITELEWYGEALKAQRQRKPLK